ncbi:MAG: dUTP diphosphatase [Gammaproteobacteria bacterium]|nr:dUTP diphosphatase [Gammaproteobacteria bacterium]MYF29276.1 dUTP diphosphatase [Gammaproteobacteria bacterium]MYK46856.1 dUTP diphosphatase [Gammaproteobacteria bacterium]
MAAMQRRHNEQIHAEWAEQGHEYYRAVWVECAELLDHYGWKWWKRHSVNREQAVLEVVDIWHFGLSELIRAGAVNRTLASRLLTSLADPSAADFRLAVEELARSSLSSRGFDIEAFAGVMRALPLTFDELYETYVAKNVLNVFRQANGYGSGEYRKVWDGREDNEHLSELVGALDTGADSFPQDLAAALASRYAGS